MALIIKGDMPKGCEECRFHAKRAYSNYGYVHFCYAQEMAEKDKTDELMKRCPILGEIPDEHGRLVNIAPIVEKLEEMIEQTARQAEKSNWRDGRVESHYTALKIALHLLNEAEVVVETTT